jgi:hypothetical protein
MARATVRSSAAKIEDQADILVGMKSICDFLRVSEATVIKWRREYDDFPVKKNGQLTSSRAALNEWSRRLFF